MTTPASAYSIDPAQTKWDNLASIATKLTESAVPTPYPWNPAHAISSKRGGGDINSSLLGATSLVIDQPGKYVVSSDLVYAPPLGSNQQFAIVVVASNVVLDFNGWGLSLAATSATNSDVYGGVFVDGAKNVRVLNGLIRDFNGVGMYVRNSKGVKIQASTFFNNGPAPGIGLPGGSILAGGLVAVSSANLQVLDCTANQNAGFPLAFGDCRNIYTDGNHLDDNRDLLFPTGSRSLYPFGAFVTSAPFDKANSSIVVKNTTVNGNRARDTLYGISIFSLRDSYPPLGNQPVVENLEVENVTVFDNQLTANGFEGAALFCIGAILLCRNVHVRNLKVCKLGNLLPPGNAAYSVEVQGVEIGGENAEAVEVFVSNIYGNSTGENMTGINSELVSRNLVFKKCTIQDVANNSLVQRSAGINCNEFVGFPGIVEAPAVSVLVDECVVQNVQNTNAPREFAGVGFLGQALQKSLVRNCTFQNNQIGCLCVDQAPGLASSNNVFIGNTALCNELYGFVDRVPCAGNVYLDNKSYGNPLGNFVGLPNTAPDSEWNVSRNFPKNVGEYDNLSVLLGASGPRALSGETVDSDANPPASPKCERSAKKHSSKKRAAAKFSPLGDVCPYADLSPEYPFPTKITVTKELEFA